MTVWTLNADDSGHASGDPITAANSLWDAVTVGAGSSATFSSAAAKHGALGYRLVHASSTATFMRFDQLSGSMDPIRIRWTMNISARPSATPQVLYWTNAANAAIIALLALNVTGQWIVQASGTTLLTGTLMMSPNTDYHCELVLVPGTTTTNGIIGFGCIAGKDNSLTGVNNSSETYVWRTNANLGTTGVGRMSVGKINSTWAATQDLDDFQIENGTSFTSDPATWLGPPSLLTNWSDTLSADAVSSMTIDGSVASSAVLAASASAGMSIGAVRQQPASLAASAAASASIGAVRSQLAALTAGAAGSLSVQSMPQAGLVAAGAGALTVAGQKSLTALWAAVANDGLTVGALRQQNAVLAAAGLSGAAIGALRQQLATLAAAGVGGVVFSTGAAAAVAMRGTPALVVATQQGYLRTLVVRGTPALIIGAVLIPDYHPSGRVVALVLDNGLRAAVLDDGRVAALILTPAALAVLTGRP